VAPRRAAARGRSGAVGLQCALPKAGSAPRESGPPHACAGGKDRASGLARRRALCRLSGDPCVQITGPYRKTPEPLCTLDARTEVVVSVVVKRTRSSRAGRRLYACGIRAVWCVHAG
jgi:hypothetical protein